ncbi:MAG: cytochrome c peroxidase [Gammaproteobacteria bacterium]
MKLFSTLLISIVAIFLTVEGFAEGDIYIKSAPALSNLKVQYHRPTEIPFPKENPYTNEKYQLGQLLFFDPRLSNSGIMSCASCHNPGLSWTDGLPKGVGDDRKMLTRKTPFIQNLAWDELFFWDGRADSLEAQVLGPITSEAEMNMNISKLVGVLKSIGGYPDLFKKAFPPHGEISEYSISQALATFVRKQISNIAPFDLWLAGDEKAISESAKRGFIIFNGKGNCSACHSGWRFSDGSFHDIGLKSDDIGRGKYLPRLITMQHAFKTVSLRNIAKRSPYMHDGSMITLEEVIDHYDKGEIHRESISNQIFPLHLTMQEKKDLVEFLKTLTSKPIAETIPELPK